MLLIETISGEEAADCLGLTNQSIAYGVYAATSAVAACACKVTFQGVVCEYKHAVEYARRLATHYGYLCQDSN